jgi:ribonuclease HII
MPLLYCGIDEAGYGPLLGPLCVAIAAIRLDEWDKGGPAPDLWKLLGDGVCRKPADKRRRIAIDDSKKLKRPNDSTTCHPLAHLERAVLTFLSSLAPEGRPNVATGEGCRRRPQPVEEIRESLRPEGAEEEPETTQPPSLDTDLLAHVGVTLESHLWYSGPPLPLPVSTTRADIAIAANLLRLALARAGASCPILRCEAIGESAFNDILARTGTKAAATGHAITRFLRDVWDHHAVVADTCEGGPRLICDRQGGRTHYADSLAAALPGTTITPLEESPQRSRYLVAGSTCRIAGDTRPRALTITFMPDSETRHFPVALASMLAKYVRELMMARFNRYWCAQMPELKPTAGYTQDARRWLRDAAPVLTDAARAALIRRA